MGHVLIAYDLFVILIGFAALSIAAFWALKVREAYLRDFCILYSLFTAVLVISVLEKYLYLNVANFSARSGFIIVGINQVLNFSVTVAAINFFHNLYRFKARWVLTSLFVVLMVISAGLLFSPYGAVLDVSGSKIILGPVYQIAAGLYVVSFTYALVIGYGFLKRVWGTYQRALVIGLLVFATIGYIETWISTLGILPSRVVNLITENDFLYSSIPYALYGIFLIFYFLGRIIPTPNILNAPTEDFVTKYGITEREREIILKVLQGKSNADIAGELFISLATVKTHLHNIFEKIGIDSRFDLIARVRGE